MFPRRVRHRKVMLAVAPQLLSSLIAWEERTPHYLSFHGMRVEFIACNFSPWCVQSAASVSVVLWLHHFLLTSSAGFHFCCWVRYQIRSEAWPRLKNIGISRGMYSEFISCSFSPWVYAQCTASLLPPSTRFSVLLSRSVPELWSEAWSSVQNVAVFRGI